MRGKNYKCVWVLCILCFGLLVARPAAAASYSDTEAGGTAKAGDVLQDGDFQVSVEAGIDGFLAYEYPSMIRVTVLGKKDFAGTLRLIPDNMSGGKTVAYGEDIALAAGEEKTFTLYTGGFSAGNKITITLLNKKGKKVFEKEKSLNISSTDAHVMTGVMSDDYNGFQYLAGMSLEFAGNTMWDTDLLELEPETFPEQSSALSIFNYVIIDNIDTGRLSDAQYAALKDWVNNGGVLILALGGNYQNVLNRFDDDFISGTIGSLSKKNLSWNIGFQGINIQPENQLTEETQEKMEEPDIVLAGVDCVEFAVDSGRELTGFSNDQTAFYRDIGLGRVIVLSYSLSMEPFASYENRDLITAKLMTADLPQSIRNRLGSGVTALQGMPEGFELAPLADRSRKPSAALYALILLAYVLLVGPVLYLILKKLKKQEKLWVAIPAVTLAFTLIVFLSGFLFRVNKPLVDTFSLVMPDGGSMTEKLFVNVTCPKAKEYVIRMKPEYGGLQWDSSGYDFRLFDLNTKETDFDYLVKKGAEGTELAINNSGTFEKSEFSLQRTDQSGIGQIDADLKCYTAGFEGSITNNTQYDLTNVVINFEKYIYQAGDLDRGETVKIDPNKLLVSTGYGTFQDLLNKQTYVSRETRRQYRMNIAMESAFVNVNNLGQGCIWGQLRGYQPDFIGKTSVKQYSLGMLYQTFDATYEDAAADFCPDISQLALASDWEIDENGYFYNNTPVTVAYSFEEHPDITTLENTCFDEYDTSQHRNYAQVYAMNPETNQFERIFEDSGILTGKDFSKYMKEGVIVLQYVPSTADYYENYIPRISARGDE